MKQLPYTKIKIFISFILVVIVLYAIRMDNDYKLTITQENQQSMEYQIFYDNHSLEVFSEDFSIRKSINSNSKFIDVSFFIPKQHSNKLRIDFGVNQQEIKVREIKISTFFRDKIVTPNKFEQVFSYHNQVNFSNQNNEIKLILLGNDAYVESFDLTIISFGGIKASAYLFSFIVFCIFFITLSLAQVLIIKKHNFDRKLLAFIKLINKKIIVTVVIVVFVIGLIFHVNFSSIGAYNEILTNVNNESFQSHTLGQARWIRSDEFNFDTPIRFLGQVNNNFERQSDRYAIIPSDMLVLGGVTKDIISILLPLYWGFLLFGFDMGLSWLHLGALILAIVFAYYFLKILTNNKKVSIIGAILIAYAPMTEWWSGAWRIPFPWLMMAIVVCIFYFFSVKTIKEKTFYAIGIFFACVSFSFMTLYPVYQVLYAYIGFGFIFILFFYNRKSFSIRKKDYFFLGVVLSLFTILVIYFLISGKDAILIISQSVYPGKRMSTGGDLPFYYLATYLLDIILPFKNVDFSNNCEVASFFTLFPLPLTISYISLKEGKANLYIKYILGFSVFLFIFMFIGIPEWLSKITLFSLLLSYRGYFIFAFLMMLLLILCTASLWDMNLIRKKYIIAVNASQLIFLYCVWQKANVIVGNLGVTLFVGICIFNLLLSNMFLYRKKIYFLIALLVINLFATIPINPINFGTECLTESGLAKTIQQIDKKDPGVWLVNNAVLSKYVAAQGVKCYNAINYPFQKETWKVVDEKREFEDYYNRYAHISINFTNEETSFDLLIQDSLNVNLNFEDIGKLKTNYILSYGNELTYGSENFELKQIYVSANKNLFIYKIIYTD